MGGAAGWPASAFGRGPPFSAAVDGQVIVSRRRRRCLKSARAPMATATKERIGSAEILSQRLNIPAERQTDTGSKRLAFAMRDLGWEGPDRMRIVQKPAQARIPPSRHTPTGGTIMKQ